MDIIIITTITVTEKRKKKREKENFRINDRISQNIRTIINAFLGSQLSASSPLL